jgi:hypothetical protein
LSDLSLFLLFLVNLSESYNGLKNCPGQRKHILDLFPFELGAEGDVMRCETEIGQPNDVVCKVVDETAAG